MPKQIEFSIGGVKATGKNRTEAKELCILRAGNALDKLNRVLYMPNILSYGGFFCIVFPSILDDGTILYQYTNPRKLSELGDPDTHNGVDLIHRGVGSSGYYNDQSRAASVAISHILQAYLPEIPEQLPEQWLHPEEVENLKTLRRLHIESKPAVQPQPAA